MKKNSYIVLAMMLIYITIPKYTFASEISNDVLEEQKNEYGISSFINEAKKYTEEFDVSEIFKASVSGKFDNNNIIKLISKILGKNLKETLLTISGIIVIVIINSILKAISENLGNDSVSKIAYYIQYILIITLVMSNFSKVINEMKVAIQDLTSFSNTLIPVMTTLIIATGNMTTSSVIEPILLLLITFIGNFVTNILIPILLVATAIGLISKISDQVQITKLSKYMKKSSVWILTTVLTIFIGIASLEGGLTSNIDGVTKKAGKSIVAAAVPVVGNILGDAIETLAGYSNIIKNATGVVGIVVILSICLKPIINLAMFTIVYYLAASLCEPVADGKVVEIIEQMAETFKVMLAVMFTITTMIIVGLAIVMKITSWKY